MEVEVREKRVATEGVYYTEMHSVAMWILVSLRAASEMDSLSIDETRGTRPRSSHASALPVKNVTTQMKRD